MNDYFSEDTLENCLSRIIDYRGKTPKKLGGNWTNSGYRAISANNVKFDGLHKLNDIRYLNENMYLKWMRDEIIRGDILLTSEAPAGQAMVWDSDEKIVLSQRLYGLRVNDKLNNWYLKYYIQSTTGQYEILKNNSGSTVLGISAQTFKNIIVRYPEKQYQILIGRMLSSIDKKIELNNQINNKLEQLAKTIYDYWFVQYDFPGSNGKPYKSNGGKMIWDDVSKREIPENWKLSKLGVLGSFKNGINYDPSVKGDTNVNIINVRNISNSTWFISKYDLDSIALPKKSIANYIIMDNDIIIARSGIPGATRLLYEYEKDTIYCGFIIRYQVYESKYKNYLFFSLKDFEHAMTSKSAGTIMQNVNQDTLNRFVVPIPNNDLISRFNQYIFPIFKRINNNLKENKNLETLRDWLLPMLMNGQVKVAAD